MDKYIITEEYSVRSAIEKMTSENIKAVVVVKNDIITGLFSNGDMRKYFLAGGELSECIVNAMNRKPKLYHSLTEIEEERKTIHRVIYPVVDADNKLIKVVDYENNDNMVNTSLENVPLVIMAGGKGTRLYPYTKILPKALMPIGELTITERIIDSFRKYGCKSVHMILNHKAGMIKSYMSDLKKDYEITFYEEEKFLGTGGGLKLIAKDIKDTFILSNCDILIKDDLECIYKTHKMKNNKITFVCSMKNVVIPYGVIEADSDGSIKKMKEKPDFSFLVNTGVYVVEPDVLDEINSGEFIHMPDLAQRLIDKGENVGVFPIPEESWLDMGQFNAMQDMLRKLDIE